MQKFKYVTLLLITLVASLSLTSCDDDDYYDRYDQNFIGTWALISVNGLEPAQEWDYEFYGDGRGAQVINPGVPGEYTIPFDWETYYNPNGATYLNLYPYSGGTLSYLANMYFQGGAYLLELNDLDTGDELIFQLY